MSKTLTLNQVQLLVLAYGSEVVHGKRISEFLQALVFSTM